MPNLSFIVSLLCIANIVYTTNAELQAVTQELPCTVCIGGQTVGLPDKTINLPGVSAGQLTCSQLDTILPVMYPNGTEHTLCQSIQSVGALCGCPSTKEDTNGSSAALPCSICKDDAPMAFPSRPLDFFQDSLGGIVPDCELVDAFLRTSYSQEDTTCTAAQSFLSEYCECIGSITSATTDIFERPCTLCDDGSPVALPDEVINIEGFPFQTCKQLDDAVSTVFTSATDQCEIFQSISSLCGCPKKANACAMCPDGGPIAYPDKPARFLKDFFGGAAPSCKVFEAFSHSVDSDSDECRLIQSSSGFCGCAAVVDHCHVCDEGDELKPEYEETELDPVLVAMMGMSDVPFSITCELVVSMQFQLAESALECSQLRGRRDVCGCNNGEFLYTGTKSKRDKQVLAFLPSISGSLSLIGALAIIVDVALNKQKRSQIYNQLMASMSFFDVLSSIAFIVSTAANPVDDVWPIYGERGNAATCTAQGFFIQLGLTTIYYNTSLAAYYLMAIVLGWRGDTLRSKVKYMHALPVILGGSLSFAGIPFYGTISAVCHIPAPILADSWVPIVWLVVVPQSIMLTICTVLMFLVWLKVHRNVSIASKLGLKARPSQDGAAQLASYEKSESTLVTIQRVERSVMWQALIYLGNFYISGSCHLVLIREATRFGMPYEMYCAVIFLIPLNPFLNALNYFRPRIARCLCQLWVHRRSDLQQQGVSERVEDELQSKSRRSFVALGTSNGRARSGSREGSVWNDADSSDEFGTILEPSAYLERKRRIPGSAITSSVETGASMTTQAMACIAE